MTLKQDEASLRALTADWLDGRPDPTAIKEA